jgi:hypothetical protein
MDAVTQANREAWEAASRKHVREYDDLLAQAASGAALNAVERALLSGILDGAPEVVHLQSGHGLEDAALVQAGAKAVVGVDYSGTSPPGPRSGGLTSWGFGRGRNILLLREFWCTSGGPYTRRVPAMYLGDFPPTLARAPRWPTKMAEPHAGPGPACPVNHCICCAGRRRG